MNLLLYLIIIYLIASIPFGLVISKIFYNKDIRKEGSGNIGATNVARILGKKFAIIVFLLDGAKGYISVVVMPFIFEDQANIKAIMAIALLIVILGHIFPIYLKFKGGKGVAPTAATLFAIDVTIGLFFALIWVLMFTLKRISGLSSLTSTFLLPFFAIYLQKSAIEIIILFIISSLIFIKHKDNIKKLINDSK